MEDELFMAVRRTEHVELVTSCAVNVEPAAAKDAGPGPRTVRLPEEPFSLPSLAAGAAECSSSSLESPAKWQQVDDFFHDITDLFQIDPLPVV
ncbi:hypothetical protein EJB05_56793, partial [Eragrostis curvula]